VKSLRVLVVRIGAMGDVLHALPAVAALRARRPDVHIGWAIEPRWADLLQIAGDDEDLSQGIGRRAGPALIDTWYSVPTQQWKRQPFSRTTRTEISLLKELLEWEKYDVVVDLQGSIKSSIVGWMAKAKVYAGPEQPRERLARLLYRTKVPTTKEHVVEQACEILGAAVGEPLQPGRVQIPMQPAEEHWADAELGAERYCLLAPTAGWGAKEWPAERYGEVAQALSRLGYSVIVNATSGDDPIAARVVAASGDRARAVPATLRQLISLVRRSELVIGGDSGPLHLAAALEHPVVGLYGPTSPARTGPWGTRSRVLRHAESVTSHKRVKETDAGLLQISADEVVQAAMQVLEISDDGWRG
jgi:heptosyltransferase-1